MSTIPAAHGFFSEEATCYAIYEGVRERPTRARLHGHGQEGLERPQGWDHRGGLVRGRHLPPPDCEGGPASEMTEAILKGRWNTTGAEGREMKDYADNRASK